MTIELIDTHANLDADALLDDQQECINRAVAAGVTRIITIGSGRGANGFRSAVELAESSPHVWATVGVHPHDAAGEFDRAQLEALAHHPRVVAIGETGLDFFRDWSPHEAQREIFAFQIELAKRVKKPLIIHSREAGEECLATLQQLDAQQVGGVFHCFAENALFAARLREIGFLVSFPGVVTFKKADDMRATCAEVPLDQILVETDAPYMAPEPHRGKRCEPAFVVETARRIATVKGITLAALAQATNENALRLFTHLR